MVLNVTENKQNVACSYTKTDKCMNEFGRSVNGQTLWGEGGTTSSYYTPSTLVKGETVLIPVLNHHQLNPY